MTEVVLLPLVPFAVALATVAALARRRRHRLRRQQNAEFCRNALAAALADIELPTEGAP